MRRPYAAALMLAAPRMEKSCKSFSKNQNYEPCTKIGKKMGKYLFDEDAAKIILKLHIAHVVDTHYSAV